MWFFIISGLIMLLIYFPIGITLLIIGAICAAFRGKNKEQGIPQGDQRKCPFCAELIKKEAIVCKHCHKDVPKYEEPKPPETPQGKLQGKIGYGPTPEGFCGFCYNNMKSGAKQCWNCKRVFEPNDRITFGNMKARG
jgi:hypothetical protein